MIKLEIVDEILQIKMARTVFGKPLYFTAAYLVDGILIDTGCAHTAQELSAALSDYKIEVIVNTHFHEDHVGGNNRIVGEHKPRVYAHARAIPIIENPRLNSLKPYQKIIWGRPDSCAVQPINNDLESNKCVFEIIETPGHSPDHICLFEKKHGWLFSGDAFIGGRDKALRADCNIWQIIESLKVMSVLNPSILCTGSGSVRKNPQQDFIDKVAYLEDLGSKLLQLFQTGYKYSEIRNMVLGREMAIAYYTLGHFSGLNLIRSYIENSAIRPSANDLSSR
jgi:glyoxylase-like metal-dependent hydrolase (beta-lactamase superfamily II)